MELVPAVDIECINNPIQVSFCADNFVESTEFGGECHFVAANGDEPTQQHEYVVCSSPVQGQLFERMRHSTDNSDEADQDENFWLQRNEEYEFDMLDGISDISVDSADYPIPEPKITLESIAQRWLDKMTSDDRNGEPDNNKLTNGVEELHVVKMDELANADNEDKSTESVKDIKIQHSPSPDSSNNSIQPQSTNSTFTKMEGSCAEVDVEAINHINTPTSGDKDNVEHLNANGIASFEETSTVPQKTSVPQLQAPSTKNAINEQMVCGEVAVIRECCNTTVEIEPSSVVLTESLARKGAIEKAGKPPVRSSAAVLKKKGPVVPPSIKPMFAARKLQSKNSSTIKTPTKTNHSLQNSNQSHLPNQETKFSKLMKQKEPMNIRKSLLSRPIVVSKTAAKTEGAVSVGPTKPAKLKRPVDKVNTNSRPVQSLTLPDHSTPIKNQGNLRRRSVAVSPQRDSSKANDNDKTKQKRRSGIPHFGAMTRDMKIPMSPCNKVDVQKSDIGMSPIAAVKRPFQPTKGKSARQIGIPKPKTQLNFNSSIDPLEGLDLDGPPPGGSKLIHSPAEKENKCDTVHSQWSPIKRNKGGLTAEDECIRCTKHTSKYV